jgi:hypothetical protein
MKEENTQEDLIIPLIRKATPFVVLTNRERDIDRESNLIIFNI